MMDHEERTCPRCGEPAGDHRLWPSCGLNLAPVPESPAEAASHPGDARLEIPGEPREAFRWERLSRVELNGFGEQRSRQSSNGEVSERPTTEMTVVRREAAESPTVAQPEAGNRLGDHGPDEPVVPAVRLETVAEPTEVEPEPGDANDPVARAREEARSSEQASAVGPTRFAEEAPRESSVSQPHRIASDPEDIAPDLEVIENPTEASAPTSQREADRSPVEDAIAHLDPVPPRANPQGSAEYVVAPPIAQPSGSHRVAVVCFAAVAGLVVALARRHLGRHR